MEFDDFLRERQRLLDHVRAQRHVARRNTAEQLEVVLWNMITPKLAPAHIEVSVEGRRSAAQLVLEVVVIVAHAGHDQVTVVDEVVTSFALTDQVMALRDGQIIDVISKHVTDITAAVVASYRERVLKPALRAFMDAFKGLDLGGLASDQIARFQAIELT